MEPGQAAAVAPPRRQDELVLPVNPLFHIFSRLLHTSARSRVLANLLGIVYILFSRSLHVHLFFFFQVVARMSLLLLLLVLQPPPPRVRPQVQEEFRKIHQVLYIHDAILHVPFGAAKSLSRLSLFVRLKSDRDPNPGYPERENSQTSEVAYGS